MVREMTATSQMTQVRPLLQQLMLLNLSDRQLRENK